MSDLSSLVGGAPSAANVQETTLRGRVARPPANYLDSMDVVVPSFSGGLMYEVPASNWAPSGQGVPAKDAGCLVVLDSDHDAWVPVWDGMDADVASGADVADLDSRVGVLESGLQVVTALPSSPSDGDEVIYRAVESSGEFVAWHLRYRASEGSAYKWDVLGAPSLRSFTSPSFTSSTLPTTWATATKVGMPTITLPLKGVYDVYGLTYGQTGGTGTVGGVGPGGRLYTAISDAQNGPGLGYTNIALPGGFMRGALVNNAWYEAVAAGKVMSIYTFRNSSADDMAPLEFSLLRATPRRVG